LEGAARETSKLASVFGKNEAVSELGELVSLLMEARVLD